MTSKRPRGEHHALADISADLDCAHCKRFVDASRRIRRARAGDLWFGDSNLPAIDEISAAGLPANVSILDTINGVSGGIAWIP